MTRHPAPVLPDPSLETRADARARALRTARAVTLGLAVAAGASGCDVATGAWCDVFTETRMCCDRAPGRYWNTTTNHCETMMPVEGPIVAPDLPAGAERLA